MLPLNKDAPRGISPMWGLFALTLGAVVVAFIGVGLNASNSVDRPDWILWWGWGESLQWSLLMLLASFFGAFIASRNAIGRTFAWGGASGAVALAANQFAAYLILEKPGEPPVDVGVLLASDVAFMSAWVLLGVLMPLTFPTGKLVSPRWRYAAFLGALGAGMVLASHLIRVDLGTAYHGLRAENPLGIPALQPLIGFLELGYFALFAADALAVMSLIVRWIRSRGEERLQLKVVVFATTCSILIAITATNLSGILGEDSSVSILLTLIADLSLYSIPGSMILAVLRYRLYNVDVVVNRALVYGSLTAILALAYTGLIILMQSLLSGITAGSDLTVIASTLIIAALFRPLKARIQTFIDRRFYRRKYDGVISVDRFSRRLRQQIDMATLAEELKGVVVDTMQPRTMFLWTRPQAGIASDDAASS